MSRTSCAANVADVVPGSRLVSVEVEDMSQERRFLTVPEPKSPCTVTVRDEEERHSTAMKGLPLVGMLGLRVAEIVHEPRLSVCALLSISLLVGGFGFHPAPSPETL